MNRLILLAAAGVMLASGSPTYAQRSDGAAIAAGVLDIVGKSIEAAGRSNQNGWGNSGWGNSGWGNNKMAPNYEGGSPNSSGSQNFNNFSNRPDFFGPSNNFYPQNRPNTYYPSTPSYNYRPSNQVVYPSPSYSTVPSTYSSPSYSSPSYSSSSPAYLDPPVAPKSYSGLPIIIRCPSSEIGICSYQLLTESGKSYDYVLTPGQKQEFKESTGWKIRYDLGNGAGTKTYRLRGGKEYELRKNDNGHWAFYMSS